MNLTHGYIETQFGGMYLVESLDGLRNLVRNRAEFATKKGEVPESYIDTVIADEVDEIFPRLVCVGNVDICHGDACEGEDSPRWHDIEIAWSFSHADTIELSAEFTGRGFHVWKPNQ